MICASGGNAPRFHTLSLLPTRLRNFGRQPERQAFVAAGMVVRADELVAGKADQHCAGDHLELPAADPVAEGAVADVGDGERLVALRKRPVARTGVAAEVDDRDRPAVQGRCRDHCPAWSRKPPPTTRIA